MSDSADVKPSQMERITIQVMFNDRRECSLNRLNAMPIVLVGVSHQIQVEKDELIKESVKCRCREFIIASLASSSCR